MAEPAPKDAVVPLLEQDTGPRIRRRCLVPNMGPPQRLWGATATAVPLSRPSSVRLPHR